MEGNALQYRLYTEKDLAGVLNLWENHSGWGAITNEQFRKWYLNTPHGSCIVVIATDEKDEIVGQEVFTPSLFQVQDKQVKALRVSAPILHEKVRITSLTNGNHPIYGMLKCGIAAAFDQGYQLIYMYPAFGWVTPMKLLPRFGLPTVHIATYECFGISLSDSSTFLPVMENWQVSAHTNEFNEEYDELWKSAQQGIPINCGLIRNAKWLNWKARGHLTLEVRNRQNQELQGYVVLNKKSGLVQDILAQTGIEAAKVFQTVIHALHHLNPKKIETDFKELNGMLTPFFQQLLKDITNKTIPFNFSFGCFPVDGKVSYTELQPSNWYMMPND